MTTQPFTGLFVALATPFAPDGALDLAAFRRLVRHVVAGGADGVVVLGSTGEADDAVAEEFQPLVVVGAEAAVGDRALQQAHVGKRVAEARLQALECGGRRCRTAAFGRGCHFDRPSYLISRYTGAISSTSVPSEDRNLGPDRDRGDQTIKQPGRGLS